MNWLGRAALKVAIAWGILLTFALGLAAYGSADPRETYTFGQLLRFVLAEMVYGPSLLGLLLVASHEGMTKRTQVRWGLKLTTASIVAGAGIGLLLGVLWEVLTGWGLGVAVLGFVAGGVFGVVANRAGLVESAARWPAARQ